MYTYIYKHTCICKYETETRDNMTFQDNGYMAFHRKHKET